MRKIEWGRWLGLAMLSAALGAIFHYLRVPAATLLGPMVAAIAFGVHGWSLPMPRQTLAFTQAMVGCLVAQAFTPDLLQSLLRNWPAMLVIVTTTVLAGAIVGWFLSRARVLPGTTAAWGSAPGGAAVMVSLAEEFGADVQLVAFMQYLRVVVVVLTASLVSWALMGILPARTSPVSLPGGADAPGLGAAALTFGVAAGGVLLGKLTRFPGGALLLPMILAVIVQATGLARIHVPQAVLVISFVALGWYVGLRFSRMALLHALAALPTVLVSVFMLIGLCGGSAWLLTLLLGADPLTAYLATTPGGLESVAIIAVESGADVSLVMAIQALRLFAVVLTGPLIARWISRRA